MNTPRELLLFEHIPKTAGSTMHMILWRLYGGEGVFLSTHPARHPARIAALRQHLDDPDNPLKAIISHAGFGLHERLPAGYRYRHYTFLRDPIDRVVSHYYYQIQREKLDPKTPLETFVREDLSRSCNAQTAFLGGLELQRNLGEITPSLECYTEALLEKAKANLRQVSAIGLTERFDESLLLFKMIFGWSWMRIFYVRQRVGQLRPDALNLPEQTLKLLRQYNELDLELYRYAQTLYAAQRAALCPEGGPNLQPFQRLNALYSRVYPYARPLVHKARAWAGRD